MSQPLGRGGFTQDNELVGRPADVQVTPEGTLLVSDDLNGAVYRVNYDPDHASK